MKLETPPLSGQAARVVVVHSDNSYSPGGLNRELSELHAQRGELRAQKRNPEPSKDEVAKKDAAIKAVEHANEELKQKKNALASCVKDQEYGLQQLQQNRERQSLLHSRITQVGEELVRAKESIQPPKGSLCYGLLEKGFEQEAQFLGQVLRREVFLTARHNAFDLIERLDERAGVFGLDIDPSKLPRSHWDSTQIERVEKEIEALREKKEGLEAELHSAQKEEKEQHQANQKSQVLQSRLERELEQGEASLRQLELEKEASEQRFNEHVEHLTLQIQANITKVEQKIKQVEAAISSLAEEKADALKELDEQMRARKKEVQEQSEAQKQALSEREEQNSTSHLEQLALLEEQRQSHYEEKGVDAEAISRCEQGINQLRSQVNEIESWIGLLSEYNAHLELRATKLPEYEERQRVLKRKCDNVTAEAKKLNAELVNQKSHFNQAINAAYAEHRLAKKEHEHVFDFLNGHINECIQRFGLVAGRANYEATYGIEKIREQFTKGSTRLAALYREIEKELTKVASIFTQASGDSATGKYYSSINEEIKDSPLEWLNRWFEEGELEVYVNGVGFSAKASLELLRLLNSDLSLFRDRLKKQNRRVRENLERTHVFDVISNVDLSIDCKPSFIKTTERCQKLIDAWDEELSQRYSQSDGLPSEGLIRQWCAFNEEVLGGGSSLEISLHREIEISGVITENNVKRNIGSFSEYSLVGSNGTGYLLLVILLMAISNGLRGEGKTRLTWPLDEIADVDAPNTEKMMEMLRRNNIELLSGTPSESDLARRVYGNVLRLHREKGIELLQTQRTYLEAGGKPLADTNAMWGLDLEGVVSGGLLSQSPELASVVEAVLSQSQVKENDSEGIAQDGTRNHTAPDTLLGE